MSLIYHVLKKIDSYRVYCLKFRIDNNVKEEIYSRVILKIIMCFIEMKAFTSVLKSIFTLPGKTNAYTEL